MNDPKPSYLQFPYLSKVGHCSLLEFCNQKVGKIQGARGRVLHIAMGGT
jgi:hypothetical protein